MGGAGTLGTVSREHSCSSSWSRSDMEAPYGNDFVCLFGLLLVCFSRVSLCNLGCYGTHFVDQAIPKPRDPPATPYWVLGLKTCITATLTFFISFSFF